MPPLRARPAGTERRSAARAGRFTGVVVGAWRGCYFVRGEDGGEDLLLHADDLDAGRPTRVDLSAPPCNAILAVGDHICYALAPARYARTASRTADRLKCVPAASTRPPTSRTGRAASSTARRRRLDADSVGLLADEPLVKSTRRSRGCSPR